MTGFAVALIGAALLVFGVTGLAGYYRYRASFWRWVDPGYYVLGACTVILVALAVERNLVAEELERKQHTLEDVWRQHPNERPNAQFTTKSREMVDVSLEGLRTGVERARYCAYGPKYECSVFEPIRDEYEKVFAGFSPLKGTNDENEARYEQDFCTRSLRFVNAMAQRGDLLDGGAWATLKEVLAHRVDLDVPQDRAKADLAMRINQSQRLLRENVKPANAEVTTTLLDGFRDYALLTMSMVDFCTTMPQSNRLPLAMLDRWRGEDLHRAQINSNVQHQLDLARRTDAKTLVQKVSIFLQTDVWPFFVLLAAAIKFGKSVADLRRAGVTRQEPSIQPALQVDAGAPTPGEELPPLSMQNGRRPD